MKQLKAVTEVVAQAMRDKETCKITICVHQGGVRDLSIDKKINLSPAKT